MDAITKDLNSLYYRLLCPRVVTIVVSLRPDGKPNAMVAAWHTPVSVNPPIVAIAIAPSRFTHNLIQNSGEFTINIPDMTLVEKVEVAGYNSGESMDKSTLFDYAPSRMLKTPIIENAIGVIECKLNRMLEMGDHSIVFGNVVGVSAKGFGEVWRTSTPILHLGTNFYTELKK